MNIQAITQVDDVLCHVLLFLPIQDIVHRVSLVNKRINSLTSQTMFYHELQITNQLLNYCGESETNQQQIDHLFRAVKSFTFDEMALYDDYYDNTIIIDNHIMTKLLETHAHTIKKVNIIGEVNHRREELAHVVKQIAPSLVYCSIPINSTFEDIACHFNCNTIQSLVFWWTFSCEIPLSKLVHGEFRVLESLSIYNHVMDLSDFEIVCETLPQLKRLVIFIQNFPNLKCIDRLQHLQSIELEIADSNSIVSSDKSFFEPLARLKRVFLIISNLEDASVLQDLTFEFNSLKYLYFTSNVSHLNPTEMDAFKSLESMNIYLDDVFIDHEYDLEWVLKYPKLKYLNLNFFRLQDRIISTIHLTQLTSLCLQNCDIEIFPDNIIRNLPNLSIIALNRNNLIYFPFHELRYLPNIRELEFRNNALTDIPDLSYLEFLQILYLDDNPFETCPLGITTLIIDFKQVTIDTCVLQKTQFESVDCSISTQQVAQIVDRTTETLKVIYQTQDRILVYVEEHDNHYPKVVLFIVNINSQKVLKQISFMTTY
jgi:hypothetical protein